MLFDQCCSYLRICRFLRGKYTTTFKKKQVATVTGQWQTNTAVEQEESASVRPRWRWWWGRRREEISEARLAQFHWFMQQLERRVASRGAKRKTTEIRTEDVDELLDDTSSFKWGWCNSHSIQRNFGRGYYDQKILWPDDKRRPWICKKINLRIELPEEHMVESTRKTVAEWMKRNAPKPMRD